MHCGQRLDDLMVNATPRFRRFLALPSQLCENSARVPAVVNSISVRIKQKDRLAAVPPKLNLMVWLGGCGSSDLPLLPAKSHEAEKADKTGDHHGPRRGQRACCKLPNPP